MSVNLRIDGATVSAVAGKLRDGAEDLMSSQQPPEPIQAGRITGVLAALGAHLAGEAETLSGQLGGAAEAVETAEQTFAEYDEDAARALTPQHEHQVAPLPPPDERGTVYTY